MGNYKIRVANEVESREAKSLFESLGFEIDFSEDGFRYGYLFSYENSQRVTGDDRLSHFTEKTNHKELTLPQLRDLVVLKRGDVGDANYTDSSRYDWYLDSNGKYHRYQGEIWVYQPFVDIEDLKPIEPKMSILDTGRLEMKEYLDKDHVLRHVKQTDGDNNVPSDWIEIPKGAEVAYFFHGLDLKSYEDDIAFYKDNIGSVYNDGDGWLGVGDEKVKPFVLSKGVLLWQRQTQPEGLPFIDDEPSLQVQHETPENKVKIVNAIESAYAAKSINDQYAEIEQVRQKTVQDTLLERQKEYGCFEDVAFLTQGLIDFLSKHTNYDEMPKPHKEALHMIASKVARLTLGNFNHKDSWHDIGGYAKLIEDLVD